MTFTNSDIITPQEAETLPGLFKKRVSRSPSNVAYRSFDSLNKIWVDTSWNDVASEVERWLRALYTENLNPGDRVAIMARNSRSWVTFDLAALELGLVVVPIYTDDRANNVLYILEHSSVKLLVIGGFSQWERLSGKLGRIQSLRRVIAITGCSDVQDDKLVCLDIWLKKGTHVSKPPLVSSKDLATIVYTSGTTGRPKGVMLSHRNILTNAYSCVRTGLANDAKLYLSFLPLSHTFERTVGYYLPIMMGAVVAHTRSIQDLPEDMQTIKPEGLISVPRIFERIYVNIKKSLSKQSFISRYIFNLTVSIGWYRFEYLNKRKGWSPVLLLWPILQKFIAQKVLDNLGGKLKIAISGGAALAPEISKFFVGLGIPLYQGYGLTETSPVVSVNTQKYNIPESIGRALSGVSIEIDENDELLVKGDSVMMGYWEDSESTAKTIDKNGWFRTGDKARIDNEYLFITGRLKDIIVLANGEKVAPVDMEHAIRSDPLFDQVMVIGEARPHLCALVVLNESEWNEFSQKNNFDPNSEIVQESEEALLKRISECLSEFPGYAQVYKVISLRESWTVENNLLTPTLKIKRNKIHEQFENQIEDAYKHQKK